MSNYTFELSWDLLYSNIFRYPEGLVKDDKGNLYVVDQDNNIKQIDEKGNLIRTWGKQGMQEGEFSSPYAIALGNDDVLYITDDQRIQRFDSEGHYIDVLGKDYDLSSIHGISLDLDHSQIFISSETLNNIQQLSLEGEFIKKFGKQGIGKGEFNHPMGIALSSTGDLYVVDHLNHRIQVFDKDGNFAFEWGKFGQKEGEFNRPHGIFIDQSNTVYVSDYFNNRIQVFDKDGTFKFKIEPIRWPREIFVENDNTIFVSEHYLKTVVKLIPNKANDRLDNSSPITNIYENLEMDFDSHTFSWKQLINIVQQHGDIEVIDIWQKIDQELLVGNPSQYANYALDLLIVLIGQSKGEIRTRIVERIREKYIPILIIIVSDPGMTWIEQKTRAKLIIEIIHDEKEYLAIIYEIIYKIIENTSGYSQFIDCISYIIYELDAYDNTEKQALKTKLNARFKDNRVDISKLSVIETIIDNR